MVLNVIDIPEAVVKAMQARAERHVVTLSEAPEVVERMTKVRQALARELLEAWAEGYVAGATAKPVQESEKEGEADDDER